MIKHRKNRIYLNNLIELNPRYRRENKFKILYNSAKNFFDSSMNILNKIAIPLILISFFSVAVQPTIEAVRFHNRNRDYNIQPNKKAILVQNKEYDDIEVINHELRRRGYDCYILGPEDTEEEIFKSINDVASESNDETKTVFYFSGHGANLEDYGQVIIVNSSNPTYDKFGITPNCLFNKLAKVKGKKAIIIDACYSGRFTLEEELEGIIENYVVIAACPEDYKTHYSPLYIMGEKLGSLTFDIYKLLNKSKPVNLSKEKIPKSTLEFLLQIPGKIISNVSYEKQRVSDIDFYL